jgi:MFS family permease
MKMDNFEQLNTRDCSTDGLPAMDEILMKYGYGAVTFKTFFITFMILSLEGIHLTYFGTLFIPIQTFYELSDLEMQIYSSLIFISVGFGSLSCGYISDKFQRVNILLFFQFIITICHFLIGTNKNIVLFTVLRFIIGYGLGVLTPLCISLLTEYLPIRFRAVALILVWLGFVFGQMYLLITMLIIMPNMEANMYPMTIMITSTLSLISFLLTLVFLKDSPRSLIISNKEDEAIAILEQLNGDKIDEYHRQKIITQTKCGINYEIAISIKEIFHHDLFKTTTLLTFIWMIISVINYGPFLISSLTMKGMGIEEEQLTNREIIIKQIWIALIGTSSNIVGGLLCESSYLGRNKTNMFSSFMALLLNVLLFTVQKHYEILFGLYGAFAGMSFNVTSTYSCEIYPTKVRDLAMGYFFFITRFGGFFSQIIYVSFHNLHIWFPYHITSALIAVYIALVFFLPIETYYRPLDTQIIQEGEIYHKLEEEKLPLTKHE